MSAGGLIFAAPKSGSGKTVIVAGLLRHLRQRGIRVAAAKCGPDYIDPTFHTLACGTPCINLDPWGMRSETLSALIADLQNDAVLVLCEGVMGLFDGAGPDGESGSTARLARLTGWPVVFVVDASGQGNSIAALLEELCPPRPQRAFGGCHLQSSRQRASRQRAVRSAPAFPTRAAKPRNSLAKRDVCRSGAASSVLYPLAKGSGTERQIERLGWSIGHALQIDRLIALARPSRFGTNGKGPGPAPFGQRIAIARDDAFAFVYEAILARWHGEGAEISFSPLADETPDPDADAIYLPGGYPELHAGRLAAVAGSRGDQRAAAQPAKPIYGECGGYMVMGEALTDANGAAHRMAGLLPLHTSFAEPRRQLGYRVATLLEPGPLGPSGARFRGHEFHYAGIVEEGAADRLFALQDASGNDLGHAGLRRGRVAGSFIHLIDRED